MSYHTCPICYTDVRHPQQTTCGSLECRDAWKHLGRDARLKHKNLATMSPSERAYCLTTEPTTTEPDPAFMDHLRHDALEEAKSKDKTPSFIRDWLSPENAPIKPEHKDSENGNPISPNARNIDSANNK